MIEFDATLYWSMLGALLSASIVLYMVGVAREAIKFTYYRALIRKGSHVIHNGEVMPVDVALRTGWKGTIGKE